MAHTRKDTLTKPPEWWKHLRPFNKRLVSKHERKAAEDDIEDRVYQEMYSVWFEPYDEKEDIDYYFEDRLYYPDYKKYREKMDSEL